LALCKQKSRTDNIFTPARLHDYGLSQETRAFLFDAYGKNTDPNLAEKRLLAKAAGTDVEIIKMYCRFFSSPSIFPFPFVVPSS